VTFRSVCRASPVSRARSTCRASNGSTRSAPWIVHRVLRDYPVPVQGADAATARLLEQSRWLT
jgi:hypothetical protein